MLGAMTLLLNIIYIFGLEYTKKLQISMYVHITITHTIHKCSESS